MPYITREDGERFVIPSYRDVLTVKSKTTLKKEILLLSQNYGEYITMQQKTNSLYEVAFSPDTGYLLGESVWNYFKRPADMIYCEAIPNTTEAILVIVKSGSVYLDGSFPLDSISEELVIFLTQQNNFEIFIYGDVPISQTPEENKFSFEASSVKSFTVLDKPVFPTLPLEKMYQLQLVDVVMKAHGIGVFPIRQILMFIVLIVVLWVAWSYLTERKQVVPEFIAPSNPYDTYNITLSSPSPAQELQDFLDKMKLLFTIPGWMPVTITYSGGDMEASVQSNGTKTEVLFAWAEQHNAKVDIRSDGIYILMSFSTRSRTVPTKIYPIKEVIGTVVDKISSVYPGNSIELGNFLNKGSYIDVTFSIKFTNVTPVVITLIAKQLADLPLVLRKMEVSIANGNLTGTITLEALGS